MATHDLPNAAQATSGPSRRQLLEDGEALVLPLFQLGLHRSALHALEPFELSPRLLLPALGLHLSDEANLLLRARRGLGYEALGGEVFVDELLERVEVSSTFVVSS